MTDLLLCAISDTHNQHTKLTIPECDFLVHAGDFTQDGSDQSILKFLDWFQWRPAKHKIFVSGNHELKANKKHQWITSEAQDRGIHYLRDSGVELDGISFYGSPWQPYFGGWEYNFPEKPLAYKHAAELTWGAIPLGTQVLITHGPPHSMHDLVPRPRPGEDPHVGCKYLLSRILQVQPRVHLFGHVHQGFGVTQRDSTLFVNCSQLNEQYQISSPHRPQLITLHSSGLTTPAGMSVSLTHNREN